MSDLNREVEIKVPLRFAFAITRALGSDARRKKFGVSGLGEAVWKQLVELATAEERLELDNQWTAAATPPTPPAPPKLKTVIKAQHRKQRRQGNPFKLLHRDLIGGTAIDKKEE